MKQTNVDKFLTSTLKVTLNTLEKKKLYPKKNVISDIVRYNMCKAIGLEAHRVKALEEVDCLADEYKKLLTKSKIKLEDLSDKHSFVEMCVCGCIALLKEVEPNVRRS